LDAIEKAGGLGSDADPGDLNLAQLLSDGQQVLIARRSGAQQSGAQQSGAGGSATRSEVRGSGPGPPGGVSSGSGAESGASNVNLNAATATQLETLPGVGPVTAAKILAWREQHGRFSRVEELQEVPGIGPKTYAEIAPHCRV
jgi:competence protein ComEA